MPEVIHMTVVLRKIVADVNEARVLAAAIKTKMADRPDVSISSSIGLSLDQPDPEPPT